MISTDRPVMESWPYELFLQFDLKKVYEESTVIIKVTLVSMVLDPKSLKLLKLIHFNSFAKQERNGGRASMQARMG